MTSIHDLAQKAAEASEAAAAQGKFWQYHDALYERQAEFAPLDPEGARQFFIGLADELGLDVDRFSAELDAGTYAALVSASEQEALALGMPGTPSVILNGELLVAGQLPSLYYQWDAVVKLIALEDRQYAAAPEMTIDLNKQYLAHVQMASGGTFTIELLPQSAPQTVNSFVFLAREGWFDGVEFHRVIPNFVAQTGDPSGTGFGGPGYTLPDEIDPALTHADKGVVAMANSGPDTNGSQWYITLGDDRRLDGSYTIFGRVVEGMEMVEQIHPRDASLNPEMPPGDRIETITIEELEP